MGRSPIAYLEGKVVGGSTVLNGGMCWRTPEDILHTWSTERHLPHLASSQMESHFEHVEDTIHARYQNTGSAGKNNQVFRQGADQLGWKWQHNKRNQKHCVGSNECVSGCPTGAKQSTALTWVPRFLKAGGDLLTRFKVKSIQTQGSRVSGVRGHLLHTPFKSSPFSIRAKHVIVSCGAVQTPLLLQRSKLYTSPHLGQHFTVHPNVKVAALFDDPIESMKGVHQAWQCTEFKDEGILLAPGGVPLAILTQCFQEVGSSLSEQMRLAPYIATGGLLVDDSQSGYVKAGWFGWDHVRYDVSDFDQNRFIRGVQLMAELYFAAGARKVYTPFSSHPTLDHPDQIKRLTHHAPRVEYTEYFTAYLMGTCRMDGRESHGVVDGSGAVYGIQGLYIADASVMPSTIGVNPQVTIMALSKVIGERLASQ
jgi:choline dehydrogenase-like flavoprotein